MQSLTRAPVLSSSCARLQSSRQPCQAFTSNRVLQPQLALARRSIAAAPRAVKDEKEELDRIVQQANQGDVWDNELVGNALKVALVAGVVAVAVFIGNLGEPIAQNAIRSFPTPADYAAYEESNGQSQHLHQPRRSVDTSIPQQPHATISMIADDTSAPAPAPPACDSTAQKAQQWQGSIAELVYYVENMAQHASRKEQHADDRGVHAQLAQLQAQLQQQTAQLHSQAEQLSVLRALLPGSSSPNGSRGNLLYQELQRRQQEADGWRSKYQLQLQCRDVAESALQETRVVVDQLFNDCAAVSGMLKNLQLIESASAATNAAKDCNSTARKASMGWLAAEFGLALLLVVCTGVATFLITRAQLQRSLRS